MEETKKRECEIKQTDKNYYNLATIIQHLFNEYGNKISEIKYTRSSAV